MKKIGSSLDMIIVNLLFSENPKYVHYKKSRQMLTIIAEAIQRYDIQHRKAVKNKYGIWSESIQRSPMDEWDFPKQSANVEYDSFRWLKLFAEKHNLSELIQEAIDTLNVLVKLGNIDPGNF